eukprot:symbB.v1.2.008816.t1/scaffold536.1/size343967/32
MSKGVTTWTEKVEAHRASLVKFRAKLQRFKLDCTVLADTATALESAAAGVEDWSTSRSTTGLLAAAKDLASLQARQDEAKESLRMCAKGSFAKLTVLPRKVNGKQIVDLSLFTKARWEAERRKGEAMLAGDDGDRVKIYDEEMPKPVREEKACNQVRGRHVLVNNAEKAKRIYTEMSVTGTADRQGFLRNASSTRFAALAMERSECLSAGQAGDLGWFSKDKENIPSKLQEVAFVTPRNACSPPFKSGSGFHLFFCEERR